MPECVLSWIVIRISCLEGKKKKKKNGGKKRYQLCVWLQTVILFLSPSSKCYKKRVYLSVFVNISNRVFSRSENFLITEWECVIHASSIETFHFRFLDRNVRMIWWRWRWRASCDTILRDEQTGCVSIASTRYILPWEKRKKKKREDTSYVKSWEEHRSTVLDRYYTGYRTSNSEKPKVRSEVESVNKERVGRSVSKPEILRSRKVQSAACMRKQDWGECCGCSRAIAEWLQARLFAT